VPVDGKGPIATDQRIPLTEICAASIGLAIDTVKILDLTPPPEIFSENQTYDIFFNLPHDAVRWNLNDWAFRPSERANFERPSACIGTWLAETIAHNRTTRVFGGDRGVSRAYGPLAGGNTWGTHRTVRPRARGRAPRVRRPDREPAGDRWTPALIALGALIAMMPGLPLIRVLIITQVINGVLLPVILVAVLRLVNNRELMGSHTNGPLYNLAAWLTTFVVSALSVLLIAATLFPNLFAK